MSDTPERSAPGPEADAGFASLDLDPRLLSALSALGYEEPTPVQLRAIPVLLEGRDLLAQAATGTGKTAAFALPMLDRLAREEGERKAVFGLVLVPTRELAMQVAEAVHRYGRGVGVRVLAVYGGSSMGLQLRALERGVDVVVATPGRALDHVKRGTLALSGVKLVVLDEADEMLDMGFAEDLEAILDATPAGRPMALFSATFPARIAGLASRRLSSPVELRLGPAREKGAAAEGAGRVKQAAYVVPRAHKLAALSRILDLEDPASAIVFCRTRTEVDEIAEKLNARGRRAEALHGGFSQEQRDRVMRRFRSGAADLLVATDVAARGLDVEQVSHVFNYDVPSEAEAYVHRIGRTGRAGRAGTAVTLFEPREQWLLANIERLTKRKIDRAAVPTVADLRARRLELTRASLRETILGGGLESFRVAVESLADEFDLLDVAAAGVKLAHEAQGSPGEEEEIPSLPVPPERPAFVPRGEAAGATTRPVRRAPRLAGAARLFVGAGRDAGIRPADLFGAITNEAKLPPRAIGAIEIADRFSLVEVPGESAEAVIEALRRTTLRGRKVLVRRDRPAPPRRTGPARDEG